VAKFRSSSTSAQVCFHNTSLIVINHGRRQRRQGDHVSLNFHTWYRFSR